MSRPAASACPDLAFPKIRRGASRQSKSIYYQRKQKRLVHDLVWARSKGRDEATGELLRDGEGELHETYPRSKTRRMAPERRFQTAWCIRVSSATHRRLTEHQWEVLFIDERGADRPEGIVCFHWSVMKRRHDLGKPMAPFVTPEEVWAAHPANKTEAVK